MNMRRRSSPDVWWPTPILVVELVNCSEFNQELAHIILEQERRLLAGSQGSPVAGLQKGLTTLWRNYNVLNWNFPACTELRLAVLSAAMDYFSQIADANDPEYRILGISAWANVLRYGQSLQVHHHDQAFVNAHYFVQTGHE